MVLKEKNVDRQKRSKDARKVGGFVLQAGQLAMKWTQMLIAEKSNIVSAYSPIFAAVMICKISLSVC